MATTSGPQAPPTPPRPPGTRVGRFVLGAPIAEGAMGAVFEATDAASGERVALKLLHGVVGPEASERFQREARAASRVSHPGIVRVVEAGETPEGERYLAMERLDGETLEARLARPETTPLEALELVRQAVGALAAAHEAGIVHRDLKPSNLFLARTADGGERVTLIDFGIAKDHTGTDPRLTATGIVLGTPFYMSPEQARAHRELGPATDVWAVGVMMYEAITGGVPFAGDSVHDVVIRACTEPHRPLSEVAPGVDGALAALVDDCLEKRPAARLADAGTLAARLDGVLARPAVRAFLARRPLAGGRPVAGGEARSQGPGEATERLPAATPGRQRRGAAAWALGLAFALVGAGAALVGGLRTGPGDLGVRPGSAPAPEVQQQAPGPQDPVARDPAALDPAALDPAALDPAAGAPVRAAGGDQPGAAAGDAAGVVPKGITSDTRPVAPAGASDPPRASGGSAAAAGSRAGGPRAGEAPGQVAGPTTGEAARAGTTAGRAAVDESASRAGEALATADAPVQPAAGSTGDPVTAAPPAPAGEGPSGTAPGEAADVAPGPGAQAPAETGPGETGSAEPDREPERPPARPPFSTF